MVSKLFRLFLLRFPAIKVCLGQFACQYGLDYDTFPVPVVRQFVCAVAHVWSSAVVASVSESGRCDTSSFLRGCGLLLNRLL